MRGQYIRSKSHKQAARRASAQGIGIYSVWLGELAPTVVPSCAFEEEAVRLGLTPPQYGESTELKKWATDNRLQRYVPEELLSRWGLTVSEHDIDL